MTKLDAGAAVAILFLLGLPSPGQAAGNPLLGRWQAEPGGARLADGSDACLAIPELDFLPTSQSMHTAATKFRPVGVVTTAAKYLVAGPKVYVSSTAGFAGAPMYTMLSTSELRDNTDCKYRKM